MGQAMVAERKRFFQIADAKDAEISKGEGNAEPAFGPVRYDAQQGAWVRLEELSATQRLEGRPDSEASAPCDGPEAERPHKAAVRESGSLLKLSSWFRTEIEGRRILVTPSPEEMSEPEPQPASIGPPSPAVGLPGNGADDTEHQASFVQHDENSSAPASSRPAQESPVPGLETETVAPAAAIQPQQLAPGRYLGGIVWRSPTDTEETISRLATPVIENVKPGPYRHAHSGATLPGGGDPVQVPAGAQDSNSARWFALKGILGGDSVPQGDSAPASASNVPVLQVFSLSGGVGTTSLVATLGRALSARGERVLLVEATSLGSLPYFFGGSESRSRSPRTFRPPASSTDTPIRVATASPEVPVGADAWQSSLPSEIEGWARGASRVIVDAATRSAGTIRALARIAPRVLVPLVPDVRSVLAVKAIDSFLQHESGEPDALPVVHYLLNQFDPGLPLHMEVRKILRDELGDRLLTFELQRTPAISEALAEGMTIIDYAPDSAAVGSFICLAKWLQEVLPSADGKSHDRRWSER